MNKILYIGNYLDATSWGKICRDYLTAMIQDGLDIVARPYVYAISHRFIASPPIIQMVEDKDSAGASICIQQVPIRDAVIDRRFKRNIFIFGETTSDWHHKNAILDKFSNCDILCTNDETYFAFRHLHKNNNINLYRVDYPTHVVSQALSQDVPKLEYLNQPTYKFYTIGKISARKNVRKLLQAFYLEFDRDENVDLVFKITADIDPAEAGQIVANTFQQVLEDLKKYPSISDYIQPKIITGWSDDENLVQLHKSCNCFVNPSWSEHQDYLSIHAHTAGNQVISKYFLPSEYEDEKMIMELNPINLSSYQFDKNELISDLSLPSLMRLMRHAFENSNAFRNYRSDPRNDLIKVLRESCSTNSL